MSTRSLFSRLVVVAVLSVVVAAYVYAGCGTVTVTSVTPNAGPVAGGTSVTITGTNFINPVGVTFGGVAATNVVFVNSTSVTATSPAHAAGAVDVVVTNQGICGGTSGTLPSGFTYQAAAAVASPGPTVSPLGLAALAGILALVGALVIKR
jgi:hypothetical protein